MIDCINNLCMSLENLTVRSYYVPRIAPCQVTVLLLGERLQRIRKLRGFTQEGLAKALGGTTRGAVSAWETGRNQPDLETLGRIAHILNVSVDYLVGASDWMTPEKNIKLPQTDERLIPIAFHSTRLHPYHRHNSLIFSVPWRYITVSLSLLTVP